MAFVSSPIKGVYVTIGNPIYLSFSFHDMQNNSLTFLTLALFNHLVTGKCAKEPVFPPTLQN